jgi:hypothetical protein
MKSMKTKLTTVVAAALMMLLCSINVVVAAVRDGERDWYQITLLENEYRGDICVTIAYEPRAAKDAKVLALANDLGEVWVWLKTAEHNKTSVTIIIPINFFHKQANGMYSTFVKIPGYCVRGYRLNQR